MELSSSIIGLAVLALSIAPIVILQRSRKNKRIEMQRQFVRLAESKGIVPDLVDFWSDKAIGLDSASKRVFFTDNLSGLSNLLIDLKQVHSIEKEITKKKLGEEKVIDKLRLVFRLKPDGNKIVNLEFYNQEKDLSMNGELPLMEKWHQYVSALLKE